MMPEQIMITIVSDEEALEKAYNEGIVKHPDVAFTIAEFLQAHKKGVFSDEQLAEAFSNIVCTNKKVYASAKKYFNKQHLKLELIPNF